MSCVSGYYAYVTADPSPIVTYNTPHGDYTFSTSSTIDCFPDDSGCVTTATATPFC